MIKIITILISLLSILGCSSCKSISPKQTAPNTPTNLSEFVQRADVAEYIKCNYVKLFNEKIEPFKNEMVIFTDNNESYFIWAPSYIRNSEKETDRLRWNLFWGKNKNFYQLPTYGMGGKNRQNESPLVF